MCEIRKSEYETREEFYEAVKRYDEETVKQLMNLHRLHHDWLTDIVVRFVIGRIEIAIEKTLPKFISKLEE